MAPTATRALSDPTLLAQRLRRARSAPNVRAINEWALGIAPRFRLPHPVPLVDPESGGVKSRVLFLLESPGQRAVDGRQGLAKPGSGLLSVDNDDPTAANQHEALSRAGLAHDEVLHWNAVPWYVGQHTANAKPTADDLRLARPLLGELLALLPGVAVVVPMGRVAQRQWAVWLSHNRCALVTVPTVHPSPLGLAQPGRRDQLDLALRRVRLVVDAG